MGKVKLSPDAQTDVITVQYIALLATIEAPFKKDVTNVPVVGMSLNKYAKHVQIVAEESILGKRTKEHVLAEMGKGL